MSATTRARIVNPRLGSYFGIFVSLLASVALLSLILEQLGVADGPRRWGMFLAPLALYVAVAAAVRCGQPGEYFAAGRRVPSVFVGLGMATALIGATGMVAISGLFFLDGFDAWCISSGMVLGLLVMVTMVVPYLRKAGHFTVPSFLGRRYRSRLLRIVAAAMATVPLLLMLVAEIKVGAQAAAWLTGAHPRAMAAVLVAVAAATLVLGGARALAWSGAAKAIAALLALLVPVGIIAIIETNLPFAQVSHGPALRLVGRMEGAQGVALPRLATYAFELAGTGFEPIVRRLATPYGSIGPGAFTLGVLVIAAGTAVAPWLLVRTGATPSVYDARKSVGWAALFVGVVMTTLSAVAVFLRLAVLQDVAGRSPADAAPWFNRLVTAGWAAVEGRLPELALSSIAFRRDGVLFSLAVSGGLSDVLLHLALAGVVAAALAAGASALAALAQLVGEDVLYGANAEPARDGERILVARIAVVLVAVAAGFVAITVPADPLRLMLWALALAGATLFPVIVLSIWWKPLDAFDALLGMSAGFATAVAAILAGEMGLIPLNGFLAAGAGVPVGFAVAIAVGLMTPRPRREVLEFIRDVRMPGGETVHDREMRLLRLEQRQRSAT